MMTSNQRVKRSARSGMTLLEVILAIAVAGFVLASAASFVVSISTIWVDRQDRNFFGDHVDGVTEFIRAAFDNAGFAIGGSSEGSSSDSSGDGSDSDSGGTSPDLNVDSNDDALEVSVTIDGETTTSGGSSGNSEENSTGLISQKEDPISWKRPPGFGDYQDPLLSFELAEMPPLFTSPTAEPATGIEAFLYADDNGGLSLIWYSLIQEETEDIRDLRRTEISPLVTEVRYIYWDPDFEKWEEETEPQEGEGDDQFLLPRFLKLIFEYEGETKERTVAIPVPSKSALLF